MTRFIKLGCTPNNPQEDYSGSWYEQGIVALGWNEDLGPLDDFRNPDGSYDEARLAKKLDYTNPSTCVAKAREIKLFAEAGDDDIFVVMNGKRLIGMVDSLGPNKWDPDLPFGHYRKGRWLCCFRQNEKLRGKFEVKLRTCAVFCGKSNLNFLSERYKQVLANALPFTDVHMPTSGESRFGRYLDARNKQGSRKAESYKTVVSCLSPILKTHHKFKKLPESFCDITEIRQLHEIYRYVLQEQKKPAGGVFAGTKLTRGYWEKNFCSAAVRDYINFRILQEHDTEAEEIYRKGRDGKEVAKKLAALKIPKAKDFIFENSAEEKLVGKERLSLVETRANQGVFRSMVSANFDGACCITGLELAPALEAAHISPWKTDRGNRLNPSNGLLLNVLYHRAFDAHLIGFDEQFKLVLSPDLKETMTSTAFKNFFQKYEGVRMRTPLRFAPDKLLLAEHLEKLVR